MKAKAILQKVKKDYSAIAAEFDRTRREPWPEFPLFLAQIKKQKHLDVLDVGCGNGRLLQFLKDEPYRYIGVDNNKKLLFYAKKLNPRGKFVQGDMLKLPFKKGLFDAVFCVAALHHLPTPQLQLKALREIARVLAPGGVLILTVWNLRQPKYKKYIEKKTRHAMIPWGQDKKIKRFYYAFTAAELKNLLQSAGFDKIVKVRSEHNIAYMVDSAL